MKRFTAILLAAVMLLTMLVGCTTPAPAADTAPAAPPAVDKPAEVSPDQAPEAAAPPADANVNSNPLSDKRVRQAINYAIDMQAIIDSLMGGKALAANSMTPNGEWKVDGLENYDYNPEKARALLKEANWDPNYTLDVVYYYGDQMTADMMAAVQAYLADVGMKMSPRKIEGDLAAQLWASPADPINGPSAVDWDMAYAAIAALSLQEYYNRFQGGYTGNSHTPADPVRDQLIDATNKTGGVAEQKRLFNEIQKMENEELFVIPLYYQQVFIAQSNKLDRKGAPYGNEQYNYDWKIETWEMDPSANGVMKTNSGALEFFETPFFNPGLYFSTKVLFDHLVVADENLVPTRGQLADYTVSEDGKTIEFVLKDAKWHDGEPITAQDVKETYEYAAKVTAINAVFDQTLKALEGYDAFKDGSAKEITGIVVDANKVTFTFAQIDPNALLTFSQLPPLPMKYLRDTDPITTQQAAFWQKPIGSGPFKIKEVNMGNYTLFEANQDYHAGAPKIAQIRMYASGESDPNLVKNASAGELDYAYTKSVDDVKNIETLSNIKVIPVDIRYTRMFYPNKFPKK